MQKLALLFAVLVASVVEANPEKTFILPGGAKIEMVWIEPGTFTMGMDASGKDYHPPHPVTITRGFWIGKYELTHGQWESVVNADVPEYVPPLHDDEFGRSHSPGPDYPANALSYIHLSYLLAKMNAAEDFPEAARLGEMRPRQMAWRLPTEAEWEYTCRAGTRTKWFFGDDPGLYDEYAWYEKGVNELYHAGLKEPNLWGLYDMYGNVAEWCMDRYAPYSGGVRIDPLEVEGVVINNPNCMQPDPCRVWVIRGGCPDYSSKVWSAHREDVCCAAAHYFGYYSGARLVRNTTEDPASVCPETWGQIKRSRSKP